MRISSALWKEEEWGRSVSTEPTINLSDVFKGLGM